MHILTLSRFLAEVVYTPEFWNKLFLKFITTKLQPHSLKLSSKKEIFFEVTLIVNTFLSESRIKTLYKPYKAIMYR